MAFLILASVLVLAYFSQSLLNRQVSFSSTNLALSAYLGRAATDFIMGELRQEIVDGSTEFAVEGVTIFQPLGATNALPRKIGVAGAGGVGPWTLIKVSAGGQPVGAGETVASPESIADRSFNGRYLSSARWFGAGGPALGSQSVLPAWFYVTRSNGIAWPVPAQDKVIGRFAFTVYAVDGLLDANLAGHPTVGGTNGFAGGKSSLAYADLTALDPGGFDAAKVNALTSWRNGADAGTTNGYDSHLTHFAAAHGFLATKASHNAFLSRRDLLNATNVLSASALPYLTHFSRAVAAPSWSPAVNAEDMDDYVGGAGTTALDYKDDANDPDRFNRFLPNVRHPANAVITHYRDDGTAETYEVKAGDPLLARRFSLARLAWLGWDGPAAGISDQAIEDCFGLRWDAPKGRWEYVEFAENPTLKIKTLAQVAGEGREPNFFEMLGAGILEGSLGQHPGNHPSNVLDPGAFDLALSFQNYSGNKARHLLQIGANIIDQYDADSYPTLLLAAFGSDPDERTDVENTIAGVENLPSLYRMENVVYADPLTSVFNDPDNQELKFVLVFELWNLHQQKPASATGPAPSHFRLRAYGGVTPRWQLSNFPTPFQETGSPVNYDADPVHPGEGGTFRNLYFVDTPGQETSRFFGYPTLLRTSDMTAGNPAMETAASNFKDDSVDKNDFTTGNTSSDALVNFPYLGLLAGRVPYYRKFEEGVTTGWMTGTLKTDNLYLNVAIVPNPSFSIVLECWDGSRWRPYSAIARMARSIIGQHWMANKPGYKDRWGFGDGFLSPKFERASHFNHPPDPRTDRFSVWHRRGQKGGTEISMSSTYNAQDRAELDFAGDFPDAGSTVFRYSPGPHPQRDSVSGENVYAADYMRNQNLAHVANSTLNRGYYADTDGVVRPGDALRQEPGTLTSSATGDGRYLWRYINASPNQSLHAAGRVRRRPVILDRPFKSVAELGYAFRDLPGKNLDFWSVQSADAGLLDLFSVSDSSLPVIAGRVQLSHAPPQVIQSLLSGATKASLPAAAGAPGVAALPASTEIISAAEAQSLAGAIADGLAGTNAPLGNRADLVLGLSEKINDAIDASADVGKRFKRNKAFGEAPVRALAQATETRTWNFLIDVVAQTGRTGGGGDFAVEGEKRYWLHVAIDRFSGKIVARQLEPVL